MYYHRSGRTGEGSHIILQHKTIDKVHSSENMNKSGVPCERMKGIELFLPN
jgi:hypothetical protein